MHKQVIIIGAGISGIKAALDLYNGGIQDTLILEARDRLGGRLLSLDASLGRYDLGALWFHDALNNPLFTRALEKGNIDYYFDDGKYHYLSEDETHIDTHRFDQVMDEMMTFANFHYQQNPEAIDLLLKDLCSLYLNKYSNLLTPDQIKYSANVVRLWGELWHGEAWDVLSLKYVFDGDHLGRNVVVKSGYSKVFQNELHDLPESYQKNNILVNEQVVDIDYTSKDIRLTTSQGKQFTCDYLVVTVPQTLLKKESSAPITWSPPLPKYISNILSEIFYSSLGKVILEFDECFWPEDVDRFFAISQKDINSDYQKSRTISAWDYPCLFVNYQKISNTPTLVALTQNPLSKYIEDLEPSNKNNKIWELFRPMVQKFSGRDVPPPREIHHTNWNKDIFAQGSYSLVKYGTVDPEEITAAFQKGIQDRIRFAGAETVDGSSNGCAHGGWFSGEREAKYILERMKLKVKL